MQINCENMIITPNEDGTYKLELWGASGGNGKDQ